MHHGRLPFLGLLALLVVLPIPLGSNRPWLWLVAASWAFVLAAAVCWQLARDPSAPSAALRQARPAWLALAVFLAFSLLQIIPLPAAWIARPALTLSVDPGASLLVLIQSLFLTALFFLTLQLVSSRKRLKILMAVIVGAGVLQATYGGLMTLSGLELGPFGAKQHGRGVATGTFINRNHYAGFLELCLAVGLGFLLAQIRHGEASRSLRQTLRDWARLLGGSRMQLRLALVVMVIGLVLSHSRMGNTAFFLSLLIAGGIALAVIRRPPRGLVILLVSLIVIDILIVGTWFGVEQVVDRIADTGSYDAATQRYRDQDRLDVDAETLQATADYLWLGSGAGTFYTVFPAHRPADLRNFFDHAHNDYLEFLLEYGILGVLPLLALIVFTGVAALRALARRHDPLMRGAAFAALSAMLAYAMHSTVDFNLHIPANAAYLMVILAMAWIARSNHRRTAPDGATERSRDHSAGLGTNDAPDLPYATAAGRSNRAAPAKQMIRENPRASVILTSVFGVLKTIRSGFNQCQKNGCCSAHYAWGRPALSSRV